VIRRPLLFGELVAQVLRLLGPTLMGQAFLIVTRVLCELGFLLGAALLDRA
jgi:hypothetical protein